MWLVSRAALHDRSDSGRGPSKRAWMQTKSSAHSRSNLRLSDGDSVGPDAAAARNSILHDHECTRQLHYVTRTQVQDPFSVGGKSGVRLAGGSV
eukprot:1170053-Prymnesium_polylepis.1